MTTYRVIGLMSGSSLDGLDIADCQFMVNEAHEIQSWEILRGETLAYSQTWQDRLKNLPQASGLALAQADVAFGELIGTMTKSFMDQYQIKPDFIASHGHTVFHYPEQKLTLQIGDGAAIAAATGSRVLCDFRTQDIALGGQGAPLAPTADLYLFGEYDCCLNLGGIANISVQTPKGYVAFDICGANQILNALVEPLGLAFDDEGRMAAKGQLLPDLWDQAYQLDFFSQAYPKSLGNDWVQAQQVQAFMEHEGKVEDKLHTATKLIAQLIADHIQQVRVREQLDQSTISLLITGGGAFNSFLVECIQSACGPTVDIQIPSPTVIGFKEALLMALMGVLRIRQQSNCLATVTGALHDSINGALYEATELMAVK